jgi:hypothetical protein
VVRQFVVVACHRLTDKVGKIGHKGICLSASKG